MFYVPSAVGAPTTVTLTISSAVVFRVFECAEYSYTGTVAAVDGTPQYSTTPASGGVATISGLTTANASDLVFAACLAVDTTCTVGVDTPHAMTTIHTMLAVRRSASTFSVTRVSCSRQGGSSGRAPKCDVRNGTSTAMQ
jgi:hypothetical protein